MATLDAYQTGEQPCRNFQRADMEYDDKWFPIEHQCPLCKTGSRVFCANCHFDHHAGGWDTCQEKEAGDEPE